MNHIAGNPTVANTNKLGPTSYLPCLSQEPSPGDVSTKSSSENNNIQSIKYSQLDHQLDENLNALWFFMKSAPRPCFTQTLLTELHSLFANIEIENHQSSSTSQPIQYLVAASGVPGVYNLGGDLDNFRRYIAHGDKEELRRYAYSCLDLGYKSHTGFGQDVTSIALIQGQAMGGGFEAALSCNVLVAEESAQIGFPEILFNLFPGMGAHSYLSRRVNPGIADRIISSGRSYTGAELYELGIIDILAEDGDGVVEVNKFIKQHQKRRIGNLAMHRARQSINPITLQELRKISDIWVEAALQLDDRSLRTMCRLVSAQDKKTAVTEKQAVV